MHKIAKNEGCKTFDENSALVLSIFNSSRVQNSSVVRFVRCHNAVIPCSFTFKHKHMDFAARNRLCTRTATYVLFRKIDSLSDEPCNRNTLYPTTKNYGTLILSLTRTISQSLLFFCIIAIVKIDLRRRHLFRIVNSPQIVRKGSSS